MPDTSLGDLLGIRMVEKHSKIRVTPTVNVELNLDQLNALIDLAEAGKEQLVPGTVPTLRLARLNLRSKLTITR